MKMKKIVLSAAAFFFLMGSAMIMYASENVDEQVFYVDNNGAVQTTTGKEIVSAYDENPIRYESLFADKMYTIIGNISGIETSKTVFVEDVSYTFDAALIIDDTWVIGLPESRQDILIDFSKGDSVIVTGFLIGKEKHGDSFVLGYAAGHMATIQKNEGQDVESTDFVLDIVNQYVSGFRIQDAYDYLKTYTDSHPNLTDEETEAIEACRDEFLSACYEGTLLLKLENYMTKVEGIISTQIAKEGNKTVYDCTVPVEYLAACSKAYTTYLQNSGLSYEGNTSETVNGETDQYATLSNDNYTVKLAFGSDMTSIRIVILDKNVLVIPVPKSIEAQAGAAQEAPVNKIYSDTDTIQKVQQALNDRGYDCGTPDGVSGSKTGAAIQAFQADNGLESTGQIDDLLLGALGLK